VLPGEPMHGFALGEVIESRTPQFAPGDLVEGMLGWQDFAVLPAGELSKRDRRYAPELLLGGLGVTGLTAYFGLKEIGQPKAGETVVVSAAAGAVGSVAGQIARLLGCRVVGIAGGAEKGAWLTGRLGFDAAVDYKAGGLRQSLKAACPQGIDVYFDNVGGETLQTVLFQMNMKGRIVCCGNLSQYNEEKPGPGPMGVPGLLVVKRLRMEGFIVMDFYARRAEAEAELAAWIAAGRIEAAADVVDGLENAPQALADMFAGRNRGKLMVRIA